MKKSGRSGVELSTLGNKMYEKYKDFKIRDYGYSQFNQYVKSLKHVKGRTGRDNTESSI